MDRVRVRIDQACRDEIAAGLRVGLLGGLAALALCMPPRRPDPSADARSRAIAAAPLDTAPASASQSPRRHADFAAQTASDAAHRVANWVAAARDNQGMPFVILDKLGARVFVFDPDAHLVASTLVLLGSAPGDDSSPGIGDRPLALIRSDERTTPAGRFVTQPGHDASGDDVVWVDYDNSIAMHRVKVIDPKERRFERIATTAIADKRISNGCINVPIAFYEQWIAPTFGHARAVVYVLPEVKPLQQVFTELDADAADFSLTPSPIRSNLL